MMRRAARVGVLPKTLTLLLLTCGFLSIAHALDPSRRLTQYGHTAWRLQDGYFQGAPNAIAQTTDGYMWIGTDSGLLRFDGVQFLPWAPPSNLGIVLPNVGALLASRDGSLYIGTFAGLLRLKNNQIIRVGPASSRIEHIHEDSQGGIWVARGRLGDKLGPFCRVEVDDLHCYGASEGLVSHAADTIASDTSRSMWIGSSVGLTRWQNNSATAIPTPALQHSAGLSGVVSLAPDATGLWVGFRHSGPGLGLQRFEKGMWAPYRSGAFDSSSLTVEVILLSKNQDLWIGTTQDGIFRIHNQNVDHFGSADGLSSDTISDIREDGEGNIWIVTSEGVDNLRDLPVTKFSHRQGLTSDKVGSVLATPDGTVWAGNDGGLDLIKKQQPSSIRAPQGLPGRLVTSLLLDHTGGMWVGVDDGLYLYKKGRFTQILYPDGKPVGVTTSIAEDSEGTIWVGTVSPIGLLKVIDRNVHLIPGHPNQGYIWDMAKAPGGGIWISLGAGRLARTQNGQLYPAFQLQGGHAGPIRNLLVDADGAVWGATSLGVIQWAHGNLKIMDKQNGLPCLTIYALLRDQQNNLWLNSSCGFIKISDIQLRRWLADPKAIISVDTLNSFDGAQSSPATFRPAASTAADGTLWFANDSVLQMIDPNNLYRDTIVPPVHIEQLIADRNIIPLSSNLQLAPKTQDIELDYTALSFVKPRRVRFRYKLEGRDNDWQEAGTRRAAFYTNLRPGSYRFRVTACNGDGVWNEQGAVLTFRIRSAWYQMFWFKVLCVIFGIVATYFFYRFRMERYAAIVHMRFDERLKERTRLARDLHDTLLQTIQMSHLVAKSAQQDLANPEETARSLNRLTDWLERANDEGRDALESLHFAPEFDSGDLLEAFRIAFNDCRGAFPVELNVDVLGVTRELHPLVSEEIYRIGHEALINACRHANAKEVSIEFSYERMFSLTVRDDGCGIDTKVLQEGKKGHFGLFGMRERASRIGGTLLIESFKITGTTVVLQVPGKVAYKKNRWRKRWLGRYSQERIV